MDKAGYEAAIICPAAPDMGRTVVDGQCLIHGTPINRTEAGKDHLNPVKSAEIRDLFQNVDPRLITHISTSEIENGIPFLMGLVDAQVKASVKRIICDAVSREQLECIAFLYSDSRLLLVGAAGLDLFWSSLEKLDDSTSLVLIPGENERDENPEEVKENSEKNSRFYR